MARSVIPTPRTRLPQRNRLDHQRDQRNHQSIEQRPVLQLPLEGPRWGEPEANEPSSEPTERGVAVIDFFI